MIFESTLKTKCGTEAYMAPEMLEYKKYDGKKTDAFSLGVILFIMKTGVPPF